MKRTIIVAIACLMLLPTAALGQKKKRTSTTRRARTVTTQKTPDPAVLEGATRVADQIKILTKFIYLLGGVAKGIEQSDLAITRNEASPAVIEQTEKSKATVRSSIKDVRAGLDKLETDFRTTPALELYYITLGGVARDAAIADQQATANQFDQAGRTLLGVVNRLTDVLLRMR